MKQGLELLLSPRVLQLGVKQFGLRIMLGRSTDASISITAVPNMPRNEYGIKLTWIPSKLRVIYAGVRGSRHCHERPPIRRNVEALRFGRGLLVHFEFD
jgi:hypothetical protein